MPAEPQATLHKILELLGFTAIVEEHRMEDGILLDVKTEDSGRLIGRQGQTLADLQYITNRILFQQDPSVPKVLVDVSGSEIFGSVRQHKNELAAEDTLSQPRELDASLAGDDY